MALAIITKSHKKWQKQKILFRIWILLKNDIRSLQQHNFLKKIATFVFVRSPKGYFWVLLSEAWITKCHSSEFVTMEWQLHNFIPIVLNTFSAIKMHKHFFLYFPALYFIVTHLWVNSNNTVAEQKYWGHGWPRMFTLLKFAIVMLVNSLHSLLLNRIY